MELAGCCAEPEKPVTILEHRAHEFARDPIPRAKLEHGIEARRTRPQPESLDSSRCPHPEPTVRRGKKRVDLIAQEAVAGLESSAFPRTLFCLVDADQS